jgi:hypothetical protein
VRNEVGARAAGDVGSELLLMPHASGDNRLGARDLPKVRDELVPSDALPSPESHEGHTHGEHAWSEGERVSEGDRPGPVRDRR